MKTRPAKFTQEQLHYWKVMTPFNTALAAELERVARRHLGRPEAPA
jgi:hypothetical protein